MELLLGTGGHGRGVLAGQGARRGGVRGSSGHVDRVWDAARASFLHNLQALFYRGQRALEQLQYSAAEVVAYTVWDINNQIRYDWQRVKRGPTLELTRGGDRSARLDRRALMQQKLLQRFRAQWCGERDGAVALANTVGDGEVHSMRERIRDLGRLVRFDFDDYRPLNGGCHARPASPLCYLS